MPPCVGARNAVAKGLTAKPWVKTSLAPGSQVVKDYLEKAELQDALDALHRAGYTEERMLHFLRVLGAAFDAYVQAALSKVSLWREPFKKVGKAVRECSHLLEAWEGCTARLTTTFWAGSWKAGRFSDARLASLQQRLSEVLLLRRVAQQMGALLGEGGGNGEPGGGSGIGEGIGGDRLDPVARH